MCTMQLLQEDAAGSSFALDHLNEYEYGQSSTVTCNELVKSNFHYYLHAFLPCIVLFMYQYGIH